MIGKARQVELTEKQKKHNKVAMVIVGCVLVLCIIGSILPDSQTKDTQPTTTSDIVEPETSTSDIDTSSADKGDASEEVTASTVNEIDEPGYIELRSYAEMVLDDYLVSPSSAKYSWYEEDWNWVGGADTLRYKIESYVESENAFGAMLKNDFVMIIEFADETYQEYELVLLQIGDEKVVDTKKKIDATKAKKSQLDKNDVAIYEEVMEILNDQYDRPEDEIFKELAPKYEMTAAELKQFIRDMMEKIYN